MCVQRKNTRIRAIEGPPLGPPTDPARKEFVESPGPVNVTVEMSNDNEVEAAARPIGIWEDDAHDLGAREAYFHNSLIKAKGSMEIQKDHNVNDDELHDENLRLKDYLILHHRHVESQDETRTAGEATTFKEECCDARGFMSTGKEASTEEKCCTRGVLHADEATLAVEQAKPKRKVQFGTVLVREYDMILGDHPCCSYGPPTALDWDYLEHVPVDVFEYEYHRPPRRNRRKMCLNYYQRTKLLSDAGYTEADFKLSKREVGRDKLNRSITRNVLGQYPLHKVEDALESARRKFKRLSSKEDHWRQQKSLYTSSTSLTM